MVRNLALLATACSLLSYLAIGLTGISSAVLQPSPAGECAMSAEKYSISLDGFGYDNASNSTNFRYLISIRPETCGLDSMTLYLKNCIKESDILSVSPTAWELIQPDPKSGQSGIKTYANIEPIPAGESDMQSYFILELRGKWSAEETPASNALISYSGKTIMKTVRGPSCRNSDGRIGVNSP